MLVSRSIGPIVEMPMSLSLFRIGTLSFILSLLVIPSHSAVSSIDLGSEWLKVAVVNLKAGQSPISIAINEMSKRKSPALVAFPDPNTRLIGEEAAGLAARYPHVVFSNLRDLLGKPYPLVKKFLDSYYLPFDVVEDARGAAAFKIGIDGGDNSNVTMYSVEEMMAMVLSYAMKLAETHSKVSVKDAVISVPPYFGQAERKALLQAAQLSGVNVLGLVNEHSGAALQYGIDKDFSNGSRHVIFYDMGSSSTYAALVYFSAYSTKEFGKTVSVNQFQVKDVSWDPELGGRHMELRLVEYFTDEFNKQLGNGVDIRSSPKAIAKLKKQVKRTKEILSANTIAPISVESLYDDRDFRSTITREKFEEICEDLWEKSLVPLKEILENSGLKPDEIYAVELIGGATRVPKLQTKMLEFLGKKDLDKHLDADEAIVLGASLHAANLSDGIKLNRKLGMLDGSSYGYVIQFDGPDLLKDDTTKQLLVPRMKKLPSKMYRFIAYDKDFEVSLAYERVDLLPPGVSSPTFAQYSVFGLTDASERYSSRNLSLPIKANLHFSMSRSGIISLDRAEAVIEISEWVEIPQKNSTVENSTVSSNVSSKADRQNASEESTDNVAMDGESDNVSSSNGNSQSTIDIGTEKKLKRRTFRVPLKVTDKALGPGSLSKEALSEAKIKLETLEKKEAERRRTAELKNNLEGYIYATKEKLEYSGELEKISSSEERQSFLEKLNQAEEWLYTDGEDASATEFQERLDLLKAFGDPMFFRLDELTARPVAYEVARKYLDDLPQVVRSWESDKPWLPREKIDEVLSEAKRAKNWLDEKDAEQQKTSGFSTPIFTSGEVYEKIDDLQDKVAKVNRIPKPKVEKPLKNETESGGVKPDKPETSSEDSKSQNGQARDADASVNGKVDKPEPRDEL